MPLRINIELTMTINSEITSCSITTLHKKYKTPYNGSFVITQYFTNGMVKLEYDPKKIRYNIRQIKPYK